MSGTLYLVPTPIGNLSDLSPRCEETLRAVSFIAAEDTRVTLKLLNHLGIRKPLFSYYRHNTDTAGEKVLARLRAGEDGALVTDAGMPAISDPGEELVAQCAAEGITVVPLPGPCALICALAASGLPTSRFTFEGFLPMKKKNRMAVLASLETETRTMVLYEAPHKLRTTLADLVRTLGGERRCALCREMTKVHEEILRTTLGEAEQRYRSEEPRGEYVLVIEGAAQQPEPSCTAEDALKRVTALRESGLSLKDAVRKAAEETGVPKNELYQLAVRL